ncbi:MAG: M23 family metallopeptidase [Candidatus Eisenbacteria bacterium]|nr:M23 family metallopeptidase [Candidatus Eisenbacteria bacterium]MCC7143815.1 M23 family metallopeptidase [Candidatus Eisenbacteria bacterium]
MASQRGDTVSILVTPSRSGRVLQWTVSTWVINSVLAGLGGVCLLAILGGAAIGRSVVLGDRLREAELQVDSLRTQCERIELLERRVNEMAELDAKIKFLAGVDSYQEVETAGPMATADDGVGASPSAPRTAPHRGPISRRFGESADGGQPHPGIDIPGRVGAPIVAAGGGRVIESRLDPQLGNLVVIDHGEGLTTRYGHASELLVQVGDDVGEGTLIARLGNTGQSSAPHLHFEVLHNGQPVNPEAFIEEYRARTRAK